MVPPELLCSQHLRGEHVEIHMLVGALLRGKSIAGYLEKGQLEPALIYDRHDTLVKEMRRRGMNHRSPLLQTKASGFSVGYVDVLASLKELRRRCPACKTLIDSQRRKAKGKAMYQSPGVARIAAERNRQVAEEGWSPGHDKVEHPDGQLVRAAICYAAKAADIEVRERETTFSGPMEASYYDPWPWDREWDKRSKHSKIHCLEIAGALIAAELDRLTT